MRRTRHSLKRRAMEMVPGEGVEPSRHRWRQILSLLRLPFRHPGNSDAIILPNPGHRRKHPFCGRAALAVLAAQATLAVIAAEPTPLAEKVGSFDIEGAPGGISGISYKGGSNYVTVVDGGRGGMRPLTLVLDPLTGEPLDATLGERIPCQGTHDLEGVAYVAGNDETWASDEWFQTICSYSATGAVIRSAAIPERFKKPLYLMGFESLSIAESGLEMWTANEDTLPVDGKPSSQENGATVRLLKFVRDSLDAEWRAVAEYPYLTDKVAGGNFFDVQRSGISGLAALGGGKVIVLEREMSRGSGIPRFRMRLYLADTNKASDVSAVDSLVDAGATFADKRLLYQTKGLAMYEGITLGPKLADGSRLLVVIADAGEGGFARILVLRLHATVTASTP